MVLCKFEWFVVVVILISKVNKLILKRFLWWHSFGFGIVIAKTFVGEPKHRTVASKASPSIANGNSIDNDDDATNSKLNAEIKKRLQHASHWSMYANVKVVSLAACSIQLFWNFPDSWINRLYPWCTILFMLCYQFISSSICFSSFSSPLFFFASFFFALSYCHFMVMMLKMSSLKTTHQQSDQTHTLNETHRYAEIDTLIAQQDLKCR